MSSTLNCVMVFVISARISPSGVRLAVCSAAETDSLTVDSVAFMYKLAETCLSLGVLVRLARDERMNFRLCGEQRTIMGD